MVFQRSWSGCKRCSLKFSCAASNVQDARIRYRVKKLKRLVHCGHVCGGWGRHVPAQVRAHPSANCSRLPPFTLKVAGNAMYITSGLGTHCIIFVRALVSDGRYTPFSCQVLLLFICCCICVCWRKL